jgi:hypothetical protein
MNTPRIQLWVLIFGVGVTCHSLQAQQDLGFTYGESGISLAIPDNDPSGIARSFKTSGLTVGIPYDLTVQLSVEGSEFGAFNGDYYAYLLHETPSGSEFRLAVLMNRVGSSSGSPNGIAIRVFNSPSRIQPSTTFTNIEFLWVVSRPVR